MRELADGVRLLEPTDYRRMRWKNGRGWTTEIAVSPADAGLNGKPFDWRISMAVIEQGGNFSVFPGYDRAILVAEGAGMELNFDAAPPQRLAELHKPFSFKGEWQTRCRLLNGPVRDFNVMTARNKLIHTCKVSASSIPLDWQSHKETLLFYCFEGRAVLEGMSDGQIELGTHHTLLLEKRADGSQNLPLKLSASPTGIFVVVAMRASV